MPVLSDRLYLTTREKFTYSGKQFSDQECKEVSDKRNMGSMKIPVHKTDHKAITGASCVIEMKRSNEKGRFLEVSDYMYRYISTRVMLAML